MLRAASLVLVAMLLGLVGALAQDAPPSASDVLHNSIDAILARTGALGAGVVLFSSDSIRWEGYAAPADRAADRPVTRETVFRAGSISKRIVSAAVLSSWTRAAWACTPVRELVPEIAIQNPWAETDPVRVAHLLEHTAGFDDARIGVGGQAFPNRDGGRLRDVLVDVQRVRCRPGMTLGLRAFPSDLNPQTVHSH